MNKTVTQARPQRRSLMDHWLQDIFDGYLDGYLGDSSSRLASFNPLSLDVVESDKAIEVTADIPGIKSDELDIEIHNGTLTIRGERKHEFEETDKDKKVHRFERQFGSFSRTVALPTSCDENAAVAEVKDGILKITVPKSEAARGKKIRVTG